MLPDLSPAHILIVVVVALIVVGPKDLPMLLRKIGQFMGKMRTMANEFRSSFDEMARQSELDELRKEVEAMRAAANGNMAQLSLKDAVDMDAEGGHEGDYIAQWQAAQDAATVPVTAEPMMTRISDTPAAAKPVKTSKPQAASKAASKAAPKSAKASSAKTTAAKKAPAKAKPAAKTPAKSAAKPRKAKPAAETGA